MMRGGAIQLLLLRILVVAVSFVLMMNVTFRCKKMEIVDIVVADDVFYEMMELVNLCYTHWHSYSYCDDCCCCIDHAVAVGVHNIDHAVAAVDVLLQKILLLHLAARHHQMDLSYYMCVFFMMSKKIDTDI